MWERVSASFAQHSREDAWRVCDTEHASLWHMTSVGQLGGKWGDSGGTVGTGIGKGIGEGTGGRGTGDD